MDGNGVWRFPEGSGRKGKVERYCCNVICGSPTTAEVKGLSRDEQHCYKFWERERSFGSKKIIHDLSIPESVFMSNPQHIFQRYCIFGTTDNKVPDYIICTMMKYGETLGPPHGI